MTPMRSVQEPIYTSRLALVGGSGVPRTWMPQQFGKTWTTSRPNMRGLRGLKGCGCGPVGGCDCAPGLQGMGQTASIDQIIQNATNWFSGWAQSQLPASAAVPPQYGSTGAIATQLTNLLPWIIGGFLLYKAIK